MKLHPSTYCVRDPALPEEIRSTQLPLYLTSSFFFSDIQEGIDTFQGKTAQHFYSRYGNPTVEGVAAKIAQLEVAGSEVAAAGIMTSSGMSAISSLLMTCLRAGDKILTQPDLYGGTTELFNKVLLPLGVEPIYMPLRDLNAVEGALKADAAIKMVYFETPANPTLACLDIAALSGLARQYGAYSCVDNTFATPLGQQPLLLGADFVIHSTTKYINGHGNSIAGVIVGRDIEFVSQQVWRTMKLVGTNCSPFEAWLTATGMKTLPLRFERQSENAKAIAVFLESQSQVKRVNYPGLTSHADYLLAQKQMRYSGGMISFELSGGLEAGKQMMDRVKLCRLAPTLGDVESLIVHPASMSHVSIPREVREANGITDGLVRLSVGIEYAQDLIEDLQQAIS